MIKLFGKAERSNLLTQELGFTLLEVVLAVFIAGTAVVGSVVVLGAAVRSSGATSGNLDLQQFAQAQIETIQQANFIEHPPPTLDASSTYRPLEADVGEVTVTSGDQGVKVSFPLLDPLGAETGTTISFLVSDSGTNYRFPNPDGTFVENVVQQIDVTVTDQSSSVTMSFYKVEVP